MPDAPPEIRDIYRRHVRGNALFRNRGDGTFEDVTLAARAEFGRWAWSSDAFDFDSDGWQDLYVGNGMFTRERRRDGRVDVDSFFWRQVVAQSPLDPEAGHALRRRLARDQPTPRRATGRRPSTSATCSCATTAREASTRSRAAPGSTSTRTAGRSRCSTTTATATRTSSCWRPGLRPSCASSATTTRPGAPLSPSAWSARKSNRDAVGARVTVETDQVRVTRIVQAGSGFISQHSKELLFGLGREPGHPQGDDRLAERPRRRPFRLPLNHRVWIEEGSDAVRSEPFAQGERAAARDAPRRPQRAERARVVGNLAVRALSRARLHAAGPRRVRSVRSPSLAGQPGGDPLLGDLGAAVPAGPRRAGAPRARRLPPRAPRSSPLAVDPPADEAKVRAAALGNGCPGPGRERRGGGHLFGPQPLSLRSPRGPAPADRVPGRTPRERS